VTGLVGIPACQHCGEPFDPADRDRQPSIQHLDGSSNDPSNLEAWCFRCNTQDALAKLQPTTDTARLALARAIKARWQAAEPVRACDDPRTWPSLWRQLARERTP
jgi:hypothetical protein